MIKIKYVVLFIVLLLLFSGLACSEQEKPLEYLHFGGALLETGAEVDESLAVIDAGTTFNAGDQFYFYYHNNLPFETDTLTVQLLESDSQRLLAASNYEVDPEDKMLTDQIWFSSPGRYKIEITINGEIKASREINIE